MNWDDFESMYQKYEQEFMQKALEEFNEQSSNKKVQYLRGVYRHLLLNRLLAREGHTLKSVLESRYIHRARSAVTIAKGVSLWMKKIISRTSEDLFLQMKIDATRTLCDIFPDKTVKDGRQFVSSATEGVDIINDRKFWLTNIRHNIILEWIAANNIPVRTRAESQQANAARMSRLKKKQLED